MVQNDKNSRTIAASLYVDESPWDIPSEVVVSLAYRKPDGTNGLYSTFSDGSPAGSVSGNTATIKIKPQVLSIAGVVTASIVLTAGEETLATFPIYLQVEENPGSESPDPEPDFDYETLYDINNAINSIKLTLGNHTLNLSNPHKVTCDQIGAASQASLQAHTSNMSNPHGVTIEEIGAAPSGFGYGDANMPSLAVGNDTDGSKFNAEADKFLQKMAIGAVKQAYIQDSPFVDSTRYIGTIFKADPNYVVIDAVSSNGFHIRKRKFNGAWFPWEYVNPPMQENVEYRTTERYNNKPVYKKLVNFGTMPNNAVKSVNYVPPEQTSICKAIAISGRVGTGSTLIGYPNVVYIYAENGKVNIKTDTNMSTYSVVVEVHYFKTTD